MHRVVFFKRLAEIVGEYLKKGSKIYVEDKLQTRKWQDKDGNDRYTTEIVGNEMQMLDSTPNSQPSASSGQTPQPPTSSAQPRTEDFGEDNDIPF